MSPRDEPAATDDSFQTANDQLRSANAELNTVNSELKRRVDELLCANADLNSLLDNTQIATITLDNDLRVRSFTASVAEAYKLTKADLDRPVTEIASGLHYPQLQGDVIRVLSTLVPVDRVVRGETSGKRFLVRVLPNRASHNRIVGAVITFTDISDLVGVQAALAEGRAKLLRGELQHRVKNILAVVRSIASRTLGTSDDLENFGAHLDGRLRALGRIQSILTRTAGGRIDLEELISEELLTHAAHNGGQVVIAGPRIALKPRPAEILALALHELAMNALKYGALAQPNGQIAVSWRILNTADGQRLSVDWRESGVRALDAAPVRHGFGRDLIERGLPYELGAETSLDFLPGGVRCRIDLPLKDCGADPMRQGGQQ